MSTTDRTDAEPAQVRPGEQDGEHTVDPRNGYPISEDVPTASADPAKPGEKDAEHTVDPRNGYPISEDTK